MTKMKVTLEFTQKSLEMPYRVVKIIGPSPVVDMKKEGVASFGTVEVGRYLNEAVAKILGEFAELTTVLARRTK